jgi:hypothetical protein
LFSEVLVTFNSPGGRWLPTSRLIAPTAPANRASFEGTSTGSEEEKQTADDSAGLDPNPSLVEDTDSLPKATFTPLSELSEGKSLPPSDGVILSRIPVDEGEEFTLVVPDATVVGPLAIAGTELQMIYIVM